MDVQMPEMDGFEATARIREQEKATGGHIPIIAMTAHAIKGDRERCLEAGMDGYVTKPIDAEELVAAIARLAPRRPAQAVRPTRPTATRPSSESLRYPLKRVGGKVENLKKIARVFAPESATSLQEIRDAMAGRDGPRLCRAAHSFKGAVALFGVAAANESSCNWSRWAGRRTSGRPRTPSTSWKRRCPPSTRSWKKSSRCDRRGTATMCHLRKTLKILSTPT